MNIEDIGSRSSVILVYSMTEETLYPGAHVSPGSVETLVRRGGIADHCLMLYSFCKISAKNYQNQLMCVEAIACYISVVFLKHSVVSKY